MPVTVASMEADYQRKRDAIRARLTEFADAYREGNERIFEELVFCILTAGASARMGIICIERLRPVFIDGTYGQILAAIKDVHLYPEGRADYIVHTRAYVRDELDFKLKERIESFTDPDTLRDFIANNKGIRGVSYKEASHFLRSIGFRGYAILDKHVLQSLYELGVIDSPKPPVTKKRYIEIENKMKEFAKTIDINFDELDLLLWSGKTGVILK